MSPTVEGAVPVSPFELRPVGRVSSTLTDRESAPRQGDEGAPDAWLVLDPSVRAAVSGLAVGAEVVVLTWLDRARRDVLVVHPRGERDRPLQGVFSTRSPHRPNPIGLHVVRIRAIAGTRILVGPLEALDGTPVLDVKSVLAPPGTR